MSIKNERQLVRAKKLIKKGESSQAREIYLDILKSFPNNQDAKKGLLFLDRPIKFHPTKDELNDVINLYSSNKIKEASIAVQALIEEYPKEPLLYNICGACFSEMGLIEKAILAFNSAIELNEDYAEAYYNLGVAYQKISQLDNALIQYEKAIKSEHAYPTAHNNMGVIFLNKSQINSAVKSFEWAIAYSPNYAEAHNNLGTALQELKDFDKAKNQFEKAIHLNQKYSQAFHNLGILNEIINLPEEAINSYESAIILDPNFAEAHRNLSKIKTFNPDDKQIIQMQSLYSRDDLSIADRARLNFALADVHKDLDNQEDFFKYLNEGNKLRKEELNYSFDESNSFHNIIIELFNLPQPVVKKKSTRPNDIKPIFIVGMPRSGTTLVEQIISSHHQVHGAGELLNFRNIITPILDESLKKNSKVFSQKDFISIRQQYLDSLANLNTPEKIITDKMPMNFRLIGFILSTIPEAKVIHLKRDAIATCWSNYNHYFTSGNGFSFDQKDLAKFYILYLEIMDFWHKLFPNTIYDMSYEELTKNQKIETQKLLNYCDLEWDENCLNFHNNKRGVLTASSAQVRQKIYQGSSEAWKKHQKFLKPLIQGLNHQ